MKHHEFMSRLLRPTYVWRMASAKIPIADHWGTAITPSADDTPYVRGARTAMARAQRQIDDLVLRRAAAIADERRCAAVAEIDNPKGPYVEARCEYPKGHGKVGPGIENPRLAHVTARRDWDHGAPSKGKWWMEPVQ